MSAPLLAPPIAERLDDYLRRRARSGLAFRPGESVTAAVGLLRGCQDAADRARAAEWWLTADGRPVLQPASAVAGATSDAIAATAAALARVASLSEEPGRQLIDRLREDLQTQPPRAWEESERRLFAWVPPAPLVLGPLAPRPRHELGDPAESTSPRAHPLLALLDADLASTVSQTVREVRGWITERIRGRTRARAIAIGVTVAAIIVGAAALLPSSGEGSTPARGSDRVGQEGAAARPPTASPSREAESVPTVAPSPSRTPVASPSPEGGASPSMDAPSTDAPSTDAPSAHDDTAPAPDPEGDILDVARVLLSSYAACAGEASCEAGLREDRPAAGEPAPADPASADLTLIDDFGGLAVVRLDAERGRQYVTLVRSTDRWLVRAVRTVADQPS